MLLLAMAGLVVQDSRAATVIAKTGFVTPSMLLCCCEVPVCMWRIKIRIFLKSPRKAHVPESVTSYLFMTCFGQARSNCGLMNEDGPGDPIPSRSSDAVTSHDVLIWTRKVPDRSTMISDVKKSFVFLRYRYIMYRHLLFRKMLGVNFADIRA